MPRFSWKGLPAALLLALALLPLPAAAHEGDPDYRSVVREIVPPTDGLSAQVLDHDDALLVVNRSERTVVVLDEQGEPCARLLADGTVQLNRESSIVRENRSDDEAPDDHAGDGERLYASVTGPLLAHGGEVHEDPPADAASAGGDHAVGGHSIAWTTLDRTGRLQWHDPRISYRGPGVPPQVTDREQQTKVEDWRVPIVVGGERGAILGTLTWVGEPGAGSSFPTAAVISLVVLALLAVAAVVLVRRRRAA